MSDADDQDRSTSEGRTPLEQALDLLFYAPIGLALNAEEMVSQMAERGRQSVAAGRFIGRVAVQQGRTQVDKALDRLQDQAATLVEQLGQLGGAEVRSSPAGEPAPTAPTADMVDEPEPPAAGADEPRPGEPSVAEVNVAISDYDSLAASQVVPRLAGLSVDELEAVRRYEAARRRRMTILNRIAQLQRP
ncbi:MAG: hypothetical protein ACRD0A_13105 [Acidimicrobiales bacterium]